MTAAAAAIRRVVGETTEELRRAGLLFEIVEQRRRSFLLDGSLLVTGEVDRTTEFEQGFPVHQAYQQERWQPDPLILDDHALVATRSLARHRLARDAGDRREVSRLLHPEQRRHPLRVHGEESRPGGVLGVKAIPNRHPRGRTPG
ncbi:MAG: hypothetical protein ACRDL3_10790 [Solirubrobacterales bacterium]